MNIDNGNLQFNRYQTGTIGNARPENVAANNTQTASGNAALAQAQEGQTFTGRIVDVNGSQVTIQMDGNMMLQARMARAGSFRADQRSSDPSSPAGADGGSGEPQYG